MQQNILSRCHSLIYKVVNKERTSTHRRRALRHCKSSNQCPKVDPIQVIKVNELADIMKGVSDHDFDLISVIDSRHDYENRCGRIIGSTHIKTRNGLINLFKRNSNKMTFYVFYSDRSMVRCKIQCSLMKKIADTSKGNHKFAGCAILEGGFEKFYDCYPELCLGTCVSSLDHKYISNGQAGKCLSFFRREFIVPFPENQSKLQPDTKNKSHELEEVLELLQKKYKDGISDI